MYLMGHTDPTLTLPVYQQVLDMGKGSVELLEQTLGCTLAAARAVYNGEATAAEILGASREPAPGRSPDAVGPTNRWDERARRRGRFPERIRNRAPKTRRSALRERAFGHTKNPA